MPLLIVESQACLPLISQHKSTGTLRVHKAIWLGQQRLVKLGALSGSVTQYFEQNYDAKATFSDVVQDVALIWDRINHGARGIMING